MKVYECGLYDGREDEEFNKFLKEMWDKCEHGVNNKEIMNEIRQALNETRFANLVKFSNKKGEEFFIVRVFDAIADETTVCKLQEDDKGWYIEI